MVHKGKITGRIDPKISRQYISRHFLAQFAKINLCILGEEQTKLPVNY